MARHQPRTRRSRVSGVAFAPTTTSRGISTDAVSSGNTPVAPGDDDEDTADVDRLPLDQLMLQDAEEVLNDGGQVASSRELAPKEGQEGSRPLVFGAIRFLDLPSELRVRIYSYHFSGIGTVQDLSPDNYKNVHKKLSILRTCRRIYHEASHYFYSSHAFRIFPTHPGRFFKTRRPLLVRLSTRQRTSITKLELRLGPGFNKPPKCWFVSKKLKLPECINVRKIAVFVQLDPSHSWLDGFRKPGFYEGFSCNLLDEILKETPNVEVVEFDGYESVRKDCPIMEGLIATTLRHGKRIAWGPHHGWADAYETDDAKLVTMSPLLNQGAREVLLAA